MIAPLASAFPRRSSPPGSDAAETPPQDAATANDATAPDAAPPDPPDAASGPAPERRPIVFVHGINDSHADFDVMVDRFVDVIAHSMGALSSRYYLQRLGGHEVVAHYITLGGMHHGNRWSCLDPLPVCVWQELCPTNPLLSDINGDADAPGTPVAVCICSTSDETADLETCVFEPMETIQVDGPTHSGPTDLLEHEVTWPIVLDVIRRPVP